MSKTLVINEIEFLKKLPVYNNKVDFLINDRNSLVKESFIRFKEIKENEDDTCPGPHTVITDRASYDENITEYNIRVIGDVIIDYTGKGKAIDTTVEQITCSEKGFYNRRSYDIGKQISTGEIKGSTIVDYHTKYTTINNYQLPAFINMNFFRSDFNDPENPVLDTVTNTEFSYDDNKENTATILLAREIRQRFRKNGDIYDFKRSNMKYGYDITGELIKMDTRAKEFFEGDKADIVPRMKINEDGDYIVRYVSMDKPYNVHMTETYELSDDTFILKHISNNDQNTEIDFIWDYENDMYIYTSTYTAPDGTKCIVKGDTNRPNSGDLFSFAFTKKGLSFSKIPYFHNIYSGEADGSYFLTNNRIYETLIYDKDNILLAKYTYGYDKDKAFETYTPTCQYYTTNSNEETGLEISTFEETTLNNGNIVREICMYADPVIERNKKTILYVASEFDEKYNLISQYKALVVNI